MSEGQKTEVFIDGITSMRLMAGVVRIDFGELSQGESCVHEFNIRNAGGDRLECLAVHPSCGGCTEILSVEPESAGRDEEIDIKIRFTPSETISGNTTSMVLIRTNSEETPGLVCKIRGVVSSPDEE